MTPATNDVITSSMLGITLSFRWALVLTCYIRLLSLFLIRSRLDSHALLAHLHAHRRCLLPRCTSVLSLALSHPLCAGKTSHIRLYVCRLAQVLVCCMLLGCYSLPFLASSSCLSTSKIYAFSSSPQA